MSAVSHHFFTTCREKSKCTSKASVVQISLRATFSLILFDDFLSRVHDKRHFVKCRAGRKRCKPLHPFLSQKRKWSGPTSEWAVPAATGLTQSAARPAPTLKAARRGAQRPHTPAQDWPAPQSFSADTSGQPLPRSSRPLLPALGKKSGQRGAGTKDPAAHGDRGLRATTLQVPEPTRLEAGSLPSRAGPQVVSESGAHSPC